MFSLYWDFLFYFYFYVDRPMFFAGNFIPPTCKNRHFYFYFYVDRHQNMFGKKYVNQQIKKPWPRCDISL